MEESNKIEKIENILHIKKKKIINQESIIKKETMQNFLTTFSSLVFQRILGNINKRHSDKQEGKEIEKEILAKKKNLS